MICLTWAQNKTRFSRICPYPANALDWIVYYCGFVAGTDDEVVIQEGSCFKTARGDLKRKDECVVKEKYKTKTCEILVKNQYVTHKTVADCLKDSSIIPFLEGGD